MRKIFYLMLLSLGLGLIAPSESKAQVDSTCQVFGEGGTLTITKGSTKRFYTKYVPGATYVWSVVGTGYVSIVGTRNLHYVDVYGIECGPAKVCVSYSIDGQQPCCQCADVTVTGCTTSPSCCIYYVNSTMQFPWIKIKFRTCSVGVTSAKLFRWNGSSYVLLDTDSWPSGYNPSYTYNLDINYNLWPYGCNEIFCLKICGYNASGAECCTANFAIQTLCDGGGNFNGVSDINYPGCNSGGGGGLPIDKTAPVKSKLSLSPNPASNTVTVSFPEKNNINTIQVVDRSGNLIKTYSVKGKENFTIPVMNLKTGNYIIKPDDPLVESAIFIKQ